MALPKAVLCILGNEPAAHPAEAELRSVGFATFAVTWNELDAQQNGWIQLLPPLDDPTVNAWVIVGKPADFTDTIRSQIALLTLALTRETPPLTAFIMTGEGDFHDVPYVLNHVQLFGHTKKYAAKLMSARTRPPEFQKLPFHVKAYLDPFIGAWLEIGPPDTDVWDGFMIGVTEAKITTFGVGSRGIIPSRSTLQYPLLGIEGTIGKQSFNACAAKNFLSYKFSCYMHLDGLPDKVFCMEYPDTKNRNNSAVRQSVQFEFV